MKLKCSIGLHDWINETQSPQNGEWFRKCKHCKKRQYATYDLSYGNTNWHDCDSRGEIK